MSKCDEQQGKRSLTEERLSDWSEGSVEIEKEGTESPPTIHSADDGWSPLPLEP